MTTYKQFTQDMAITMGSLCGEYQRERTEETRLALLRYIKGLSDQGVWSRKEAKRMFYALVDAIDKRA